jgi:hypothetical protein
MADNLLEHIGDLTQVVTQKDADFFEIESTDDSSEPISRKESRLQLKNNIASSGPVPDMVTTRISDAAGIHDFETVHAYLKGAIILRLGSLYRARNNFTSGTGFIADDWELIPPGKWGGLFGNIEDQTDLANILNDLKSRMESAEGILPDKANMIIQQQISPLSLAIIGSVLRLVTFDTTSTPGAPAAAGSITLDDGSHFDIDVAGDMTYTAADTTVTQIYTGGVWQVSSIDTGTSVVTAFLNTSGGAWESGTWVSGETRTDLAEVKQTADDAETKSTTALAGLATETLRAQTEEGKKLNKNATHANGSTVISNDDTHSGFGISTIQNDTGTFFGFGTNTDAGNPIMGGMTGQTAAAPAAGSMRLLFVVDSGGNIKVHLRKGKESPVGTADLDENDESLNKGEIITLINNAVSAVSQGLLTPGIIDKESNLPDASTVINGTYYVVQDLDVTAQGQQGRAWKNNALSATDWQIVIDNVYAPDETWLSLDVGGELTIAESIQALINGAVQNSQIEQTLPDSDDQADEDKLISRRAAFGLVPKQQDAVTDDIIGNRDLEDQAGDDTLVPIAEKKLTPWLQGIRNNLKSLFNNKEPSKYVAADEAAAQTYSTSNPTVMVFYPEED